MMEKKGLTAIVTLGVLMVFYLVFLWMGFLKRDVVVDAVGMVAVKNVTTVTNLISGTITGRVVEDG